MQQTWVGTDVKDVEKNILTGDKQWLDNVWTFFSHNISVLKMIVLFRSTCLFLSQTSGNDSMKSFYF